jgi:hypothetical protein
VARQSGPPSLAGHRASKQILFCMPPSFDALPDNDVQQTPETFLKSAEKELEIGDVSQASKKFWGAASLSLDELARQLNVMTENDKVKNTFFSSLMEQCLPDEAERARMLEMWLEAQALHNNFYQDLLEAQYVSAGGKRMVQFVSEMRKLDVSRFNKKKFIALLSKFEKGKVSL